MTRRTKKSERLVPRDMKNPRPLSSGPDCGKTEKTTVSITLLRSGLYLHFVPYRVFRNPATLTAATAYSRTLCEMLFGKGTLRNFFIGKVNQKCGVFLRKP